jgi:hypothetical protein
MGSFHGTKDDFKKVSAVAQAHLSDSVKAELGVANTWMQGAKNDLLEFGGGVYYSPVSQLTIGLEASVSRAQSLSTVEDASNFGLVTAFSF